MMPNMLHIISLGKLLTAVIAIVFLVKIYNV